MSHTELQRAIKQWRGRKKQFFAFMQMHLVPWFRLYRVEGVVVNQYERAMPNVCVTINQFRSCYTDEDGYFSFIFLSAKSYNLSLKCQGIELSDFLHVHAEEGKRVTELKLRWPQLIRGQLFDQEAYGMPQVKVQLNEQYQTHTDIQGIFIFPKHMRKKNRFDSFVFTINGQEYLHHFHHTHDVLHRFCFDQKQLLYVDQSEALVPHLKHTESYLHTIKKSLMITLAVISLLLLSIFYTAEGVDYIAVRPTQPFTTMSVYPPVLKTHNTSEILLNESQMNVAAFTVLQSSQNLLSKDSSSQNVSSKTSSSKNSSSQNVPSKNPLSQGSSLNSSSTKNQMSSSSPPSHSLSVQSSDSKIDTASSSLPTYQYQIVAHKTPKSDRHIFDASLTEKDPCKAIEFVYHNYYVPRGMEGILLSLVFGEWQNWSDDLSVMNKMNKSDQLQAGQRIKLYLPMYHWKVLKIKRKSHFHDILSRLPCKQDMLCTQLVQAWNPHLDVRFLRKGDVLLIHPQLLEKLPFHLDTLKRIEKIKRFRRSRRKKPKIKLPKNCSLETI